jgi:hypothetical protein
LAIFDPYGDYVYKTGSKIDTGFAGKRVYHYRTRTEFLKAFRNAWASKKPFRVAYMPDMPTRAEMLWFCEVMWLAADGARRLDVIIEEVAKWVESPAKEQSRLGECMTGGRKFGLVMHLAFQRSTEVPKTITSEAKYKLVGVQGDKAGIKRMADECDCSYEELASLQPLQYIFKKPGIDNYELIDLRGVFYQPRATPKQMN